MKTANCEHFLQLQEKSLNLGDNDQVSRKHNEIFHQECYRSYINTKPIYYKEIRNIRKYYFYVL